MPLMRCIKRGRKGWKFGQSGHCYIGTGARAKAAKQGRAIKVNRADQSGPATLEQLLALRRAPGRRPPPVRLPRPPKWLFPLPVEREYEAALVARVNAIEAEVGRTLLPHLDRLLAEAAADLGRADAFGDSADRLMGAIELNLRRKTGPEALAVDIGQKTATWNDREWQKILKKVAGVRLFQREPWLGPMLNSWSRENVALIKSIDTSLLPRVEGIVQRGARQGLRSSTIRKEIQGAFDIGRGRARLIARDQVGKLNGQLTEARQLQAGVENYIWRDSDDARVRDNHRSKDGRRFSWDKPPADTGHPGQDVQCRCWAEPDFSDLEKGITQAGTPEDVAERARVAGPPKQGHSEWVGELTEKEDDSIRKWRGSSHRFRALEKKGETSEQLDTFNKALDKAQSYKGNIYRGLNNLGEDAYSPLRGLSKGDSLQWDASSSGAKTRANIRGFLDADREGRRNVIIQVRGNRTGVEIGTAGDPFGKNDEGEVVMRNKTRYRVVSNPEEIDTEYESRDGVFPTRALRLILEEI